MALINCSDCAADVSDKAAACPKCGAPVEGNKSVTAPSIIKIRSVLGVIALGLGLSVAAFSTIMPLNVSIILVPATFFFGILAIGKGRRAIVGLTAIALGLLASVELVYKIG